MIKMVLARQRPAGAFRLPRVGGSGEAEEKRRGANSSATWKSGENMGRNAWLSGRNGLKVGIGMSRCRLLVVSTGREAGRYGRASPAR